MNRKQVLQQIADNARCIESGFPDDAKQYHREMKLVKALRADGESELVREARHNMNLYTANCEEWRAQLSQLADAVRKHLPATASQLILVRKILPWRWQEENTDWKAVTAELRTIEEAAEAAIDDGTQDVIDVNGNVVDTITNNRGLFLVTEHKKGTPYSSVLAKLRKQPVSWQTIGTVTGIRKATKDYAQRMGIELLRRKNGRPKTKRTD